MKMKRGFIGCLLSIFVILTMFSGCNVGSTDGGEADTVLGGGSSVLRIVSGSENSELEPILEEFSDREHVRIEMTYMGSLDIDVYKRQIILSEVLVFSHYLCIMEYKKTIKERAICRAE